MIEKYNVSLNLSKTDLNKFETDELIWPNEEKDFVSKSLIDKKKYMTCILPYTVVIYILAMVFLVAIMFWIPVATVLNEVLMGFI